VILLDRPIRNSERFITAFTRIEQTLKDIVEAKEYMPFFKLLDHAKKKNALIKRYEDDLREYADLRNAIVHHRTSTEFSIAEPHDEVVAFIEKIDETLSTPITVGEMFKRDVQVFQVSDTLNQALQVIRDRNFTQLPVYDGDEFKGLLTSIGVTMWLASTVEKEMISREMTTLGDMLKHEVSEKNHRFIPKETSIYEAQEIYKRAVTKGIRLEALLITDTVLLVGIITPLDLIKIET